MIAEREIVDQQPGIPVGVREGTDLDPVWSREGRRRKRGVLLVQAADGNESEPLSQLARGRIRRNP
jgi:hypothetical protein